MYVCVCVCVCVRACVGTLGKTHAHVRGLVSMLSTEPSSRWCQAAILIQVAQRMAIEGILFIIIRTETAGRHDLALLEAQGASIVAYAQRMHDLEWDLDSQKLCWDWCRTVALMVVQHVPPRVPQLFETSRKNSSDAADRHYSTMNLRWTRLHAAVMHAQDNFRSYLHPAVPLWTRIWVTTELCTNFVL